MDTAAIIAAATFMATGVAENGAPVAQYLRARWSTRRARQRRMRRLLSMIAHFNRRR